MSGGLYVPQDACEHPRDTLRCDLRSPKGDTNPDHVRAVIQCLRFDNGYLRQWPA